MTTTATMKYAYPHLARLLAVASLAACSALPSSIPQGDARENQLAFYLGERSLDEDDWEPLDEQPTFGIEFSRVNTEGLGFEVGLMGSEDDDELGGIDFEAKTSEIYGGVRKEFPSGKARPYIGVGLSVISAEIEANLGGASASEDDDSAGLYLHGGIVVDLTEAFFIGADLRLLRGTDIELAGVDADADYNQFAIVLGFSF